VVQAEQRAPEAVPRAHWPLAIGLSVALGAAFRLTTWHGSGAPTLPAYLWAPATGVAILLYLRFARGPLQAAGSRDGGTAAPGTAAVAWAILGLALVTAYARSLSPPSIGDLALLGAMHLPAFTWLVLGAAVLGRERGPLERFAGLVKSVEALVTGGIYAGAALVFGFVTLGLLGVLQVKPPREVLETGACFLAGLVPVLAVASVYDAGLTPGAQRLGAGLTRLFFITARLFLAPTLLVLLVVASVMPARFALLAGSRATLAVFNAMLFAVMLLLVGAAPLRSGLAPAAGPAPRLEPWLRRGIVLLALLALVVSGYAFAAILSRTSLGGLTANRVTVMGWNLVNLATLAILLALQIRAGRSGWVSALHRAFGAGLVLYAAWTFLVLVALPLVARAARWPVAPGFFGPR
jgi:hypothetical protein